MQCEIGFFAMFLQVYKYLFCNNANTQNLLRVEFYICNGRESSNVLKKFVSLKVVRSPYGIY